MCVCWRKKEKLAVETEASVQYAGCRYVDGGSKRRRTRWSTSIIFPHAKTTRQRVFTAQSISAAGGPNRAAEAARMLRPARLNRGEESTSYVTVTGNHKACATIHTAGIDKGHLYVGSSASVAKCCGNAE